MCHENNSISCLLVSRVECTCSNCLTVILAVDQYFCWWSSAKHWQWDGFTVKITVFKVKADLGELGTFVVACVHITAVIKYLEPLTW